MRRLRLRAPTADQPLLSVPNLDHWRSALEENRRGRSTSPALIGGLRWNDWARLVRRETATLTSQYLARLEQPLPQPIDVDGPWIASGHQPELFHPGVWIKNVASSVLATRLSGADSGGIHVLADGDTMRTASVRVPTGRLDHPLIALVPLDDPAAEIPHEERRVINEKAFLGFASLAQSRLSTIVGDSLLPLWGSAIARTPTNLALGERISMARRVIERRAGIVNGEIPMSLLSNSEGFRRFAAHLWLEADRFRAIHNAALAEYRALNRVRSKSHPAPNLDERSGWMETPFWVWSVASPRRRRLFVERSTDTLTLWGDDERIEELPLPMGSTERAIASLAAGIANITQWKIRPRALSLSTFLRLGVTDLFIHGVGGGKYDEVTDEIIARFYGIQPPSLAILSATLLLPQARPRNPEKVLSLKRFERDLSWNPDRHLSDVLREQEPLARWIERKFELVANSASKGPERRRRFQEFRDINDRLRPYVGSQVESIRQQRVLAEEQERNASLLDSREFAYCLHSRTLPDRLLDLLTPLARS